MPSEINADIAVVGGGIAGGTLACILAAAGLTVVSIDREGLAARLEPSFDGRTTAISYGSRRVLEAAGVWSQLEPHAAPIEQIRIADGAAPTYLHFDSAAVEGRAFGWIIDNSLIRRALATRMESLRGLTPLSPATVTSFEADMGYARIGLSDGRKIRASLIVGADGKGSTMRRLAGIDLRKTDYAQTALVFVVSHTAPHHNIALEHFYGAGPFAVLPMVDGEQSVHRSSVVWTVGANEAPALLAMGETDFNAALQPLFGDYYGQVALLGKRFSYPLGLQEAKTYIGPRLALAADAAHAIHPIAGQGLNLGLRDVALLAELMVDSARLGLDIGTTTMLKSYERQRRADALKLIAATDILNRLFSNEIAPVRLTRNLGLGMVQKMPALKKSFMLTAMGLAGTPPRLVRGEAL
jgi:2-octaprenyl-6-methoxyphenol hydroxylase